MTFVESLNSYLRSYTGLTAIVGQRIYPVRAPDKPITPYVVFSVRIQPQNTLDSAPLDLATVAISGFASDTATQSGYALAHGIADQIRSALNLFRGSLAASGKSSEGSLVMFSEDSDSPAASGEFAVVTEAEIYYQP